MGLDACSAHTMGGPLVDRAPARGSLRRQLRDRRHGPTSQPEHVQLSFQPLSLRDCFLSGLMKMDGKKLLLQNLSCMYAKLLINDTYQIIDFLVLYATTTYNGSKLR